MDTSSCKPSSAPDDPAITRRGAPVTMFALAVGLPLTVVFTILLTTGKVGRFFLLFHQAASLMVELWPISLPIAIWGLFIFATRSDTNAFNGRALLWLASLIVMPITMLTWGTVFEHQHVRGNVGWHLLVVEWAFFATIAVSILAVIFNGGRRTLVAASALMFLLFSISCAYTAWAFVAGI